MNAACAVGMALGRTLPQIGRMPFDEMLQWNRWLNTQGPQVREDWRTAWAIAWTQQRTKSWIPHAGLMPPPMPRDGDEPDERTLDENVIKKHLAAMASLMKRTRKCKLKP